MTAKRAGTRDLRRDRFKVWPRGINHLSFVSTAWERQGPTRIATKSRRTIHLVHAYFTRNLASLAALSPLVRRPIYTLPGPISVTPRCPSGQAAAYRPFWSNFLNAIRFLPIEPTMNACRIGRNWGIDPEMR